MGVRSSHVTVDNLLWWWWFRPIAGTHQEGNPRPRSGPSDLVTAVLPVSSTLPNPYCRYAGPTTSALLSPNNINVTFIDPRLFEAIRYVC